MKRIVPILIILLVLSSLGGTGYYLYQKSEEKPVIFALDSAFYTDIIKKTVATGSIVPRREVNIKSQVSGVLEELYVTPGEKVSNGQLIARIRIIPNVVNLNNAENQVKTALINFKNAEREFERQKKLFDQKVIPEFDFNQQQLQFNLRKQELEAAENNLELVKKGSSVKAGTVSNLVRSTASGLVLDVPLKEGSFIIESNTFNEGTTIASIADMQQMIFEGKVDESEVGKIREGLPLLMKIGALEKDTFNARLEFISPKGKTEEGAIQFQIKAEVELKKGVFIRAGYSANADIVLDRRDSVIAIRESLILFEGEKAFVEVERKPQTFEKVSIKTGLSDGINIEILEGLSLKDRIKVRETAIKY
jgi:HlyD family secretion protein